MSRPKAAVSHVLVALQFSAIVIVAWPFVAQVADRAQWLGLSALGVIVGLYTLAHNKLGNFGIYPEPIPDACLITTGPYRWVRHPMYTSLLLFMLGIALYRDAWPNYIGFGLLCAAVFGKMQREEVHLHAKFADYSDYVQRTHRLLPRIY
ncbi:MAG: isoprenylcysteine carboxylmethyltransferase family protein [Chromatiaceae bacterium]|nr:isoprenylcysteine carboxylmethyltransferase family protein [Gammaproteobacteria bacterium]MCP5306706.1 isoprenylcysteine carboxylmethyltransferase family protein [Chromatiaceae bacterium]MCP5421792.1 isoprenylcysteine carboxylmethyltransferase family protein [Chromatiaceae bacterium]